jgi:hypothetical protein
VVDRKKATGSAVVPEPRENAYHTFCVDVGLHVNDYHFPHSSTPTCAQFTSTTKRGATPTTVFSPSDHRHRPSPPSPPSYHWFIAYLLPPPLASNRVLLCDLIPGNDAQSCIPTLIWRIPYASVCHWRIHPPPCRARRSLTKAIMAMRPACQRAGHRQLRWTHTLVPGLLSRS